MASIQQSNLAWLTARAGVLRSGTGRAGAAPKAFELKGGTTGNGQIIWDRIQPGQVDEGEPANTPGVWTNVRE